VEALYLVCGARRPQLKRDPLGGAMEIPAGWNRCMTHLQPNEFLTLTAEELEWAREYETRQLKEWARFPSHGEVYEALHDVQVRFVTHWRAPFTGGGSGLLPAGSRVRVEVYFTQEPISVYAQALDPNLETMLVPMEDRSAPKYGGYSLSITTEQLNRDFSLLGSENGAA